MLKFLSPQLFDLIPEMVTFSFYIQKKALKPFGFQRFTILISDHDRILTYNLLIRSQMLYTVELRSRFCFASANVMHFFDSAK